MIRNATYICIGTFLIASFLAFGTFEHAEASTISRPMNSNGLLAYYDFQTGINGSTAYDKSGNGKNGTFTNMEAGSDWVNGRIGQGLDFDGSNEYIQTNISELKTADNFTVSFWFNADATNYAHHIFWAGRSTANGYGEVAGGSTNQEFHLSLGEFNGTSANDKLAIFLGDTDEANGDPIQVSMDFTDTTGWHHIVGVFSNLSTAPTGHMYVDGVLVGTDTGTTADTARDGWNTDVRIGRPGADQRYFNGLLDEVRTYTRALSADEVRRLYNFSAPKIAETPVVISDGLVGHWSFDGDVTTSAATDDISGSGNAGILNGTPVQSLGRVGQALDFDGTTDYVDTNSPPTMTSWTVMAWAKPDVSGNSKTILSNDRSGWNDDVLFGVRPEPVSGTSDNFWGVTHQDATNQVRTHAFDTTEVVTGRWYHVAAWSNGTVLKLFVDGEEVASSSKTGTALSFDGADTWIGATPNVFRGFDGLLDDVRIYNRALTNEEVKRIYDATRPSAVNVTRSNDSLNNGLVGHWSFDGSDVSSTQVSDVSGNGSNGTILGNPQPTIGKIGQAFDFDGSGDYISTGDIGDSSANLTVTAWVNGTNFSATTIETIIAKETSGQNSFVLRVGDVGIGTNQLQWVIVQSNGTEGKLNSVTLETDRWYHVAATYNTSGVQRVYVDGIATSSQATADGTMNNGTAALEIGRSFAASTRVWNGLMDDVRVYSRELSADEVKRLYNLGL